MQRYFIEQNEWTKQTVTLTGEQAKHIAKVMRMREGDKVVCVNKEDQLAGVFPIQSLADQHVVVEFEEELISDVELGIHVTIAQADIKGDKFEYVLQKGTELGASRFHGFSAKHSVVKWDNKKEDKKLSRYQKIVQEAAEQSERLVLPSVMHFPNVDSLLSDSYDHRWIISEVAARDGKHEALYEAMQQVQFGDRLLAVFGPEGGFSEEEHERLVKEGFQPVSLGPRILRAETASLALLSMISYQFELMR